MIRGGKGSYKMWATETFIETVYEICLNNVTCIVFFRVQKLNSSFLYT